MTTIDKLAESRASTPWRDQDVLERLYIDRELSLRQIGDELECHWTTVRRWAIEFDIELRRSNDQKIHPSASTNTQGYRYYSSQVGDEKGLVGRHELVAILSGEDPEEVFDPETQVHHRLRLPGSFGVAQLDIPGNLEAMDAHEHLSGHRTGTHDEPTIEQVLDDDRDQ